MHLETELKFVGDEDVISLLRQSKVLQDMAGNRRARTVAQHAVYFDTQDQALRDAGYILRVRNEGDSYSQTLKRTFSDDVATRPEFKSEVSTCAPETDSIPDSKTRWKVSQLLKGRALGPVFEITTKRTKLLLSPKRGVEIEAAFDAGTLSLCGDDKQTFIPINEFELELLKGSVEDLFASARRLTADLPLTLCLAAKAERGFALLLNATYSPARAQTICLPAGALADDAIAVILGSCLQQFLGNWRTVITTNDVEGVHQMRVALRRFRSAISLLDERQQALIKNQIEAARRFANVLGDARDHDVLLTDIIQPVVEGFGNKMEVKVLTDAIVAMRTKSWSKLLDSLRSEEFRSFVLDWAAVTYRRPWLAVSGPDNALALDAYGFAKKQISHRAHQIAKIALRADDLDYRQLHDLRIRLKKLRYTIEFFGSVLSKKMAKRFARRLTKLQLLLGDMNDISTARNLIHRILLDAKSTEISEDLAFCGGLVVGWHARRLSESRSAIRKQLKKISNAKVLVKDL
ncbi:MAG: CYTH and CHAD domain-containing protein [Micropepsaceae bacterium]